MSDKRISYISWLQFVGVLSVIFGHSMNSIDVPTVFTEIKAWVYTWHMPLFFMVSAYLFAYKGAFNKGYICILKGKFMRLIVPYIIWNVAFIFPKILMADYINDQVEMSPTYFLKILLRPRDNILGHTWFLAALFEMYILAILFEKLRDTPQLWLVMTCLLIIVNCLGVTDRFLAIGDLMKNAIYFWSGLLIGRLDKQKIRSFCRDREVIIFEFLIVIITSFIWYYNRDLTVNTLILGFHAIIVFVVIQVLGNINFRFIEFVSRNAFAIYILHWPIMMVVRLVVYTKMGLNPVFTVVLMFCAGLMVPCLVAWIIRKINNKTINKLSTYVLGM